MTEAVNHPEHYKGVEGMEVMEVLQNFLPKYTDPYTSAMIKDVIKYILRAPAKGAELQDLKKAQKYLEFAIYKQERRQLQNLQQKVQEWAVARNLDKQNSTRQKLKLFEEWGELNGAYLKNDAAQLQDAIGDMLVVIIIFCLQEELNFMELFTEVKKRDKVDSSEVEDTLLAFTFEFARFTVTFDPEQKFEILENIVDALAYIAQAYGWTLQECLQAAYEEIADRTGKIVNGVFVKD